MKVKELKRACGLFFVLGLSVLSAFGFVGFMVYKYGASGRYQLKNVLLEPFVLQQIKYHESGKRMVFNDVQFHYSSDGIWVRSQVPVGTYGSFFGEIAKDLSLFEVSDEVKMGFRRGNIASLVLSVRPESEDILGTKSLQELHFSDEGNYYRVELRVDEKQETWAYFYHPGIFDKAKKLLLQ